MPNGRRISLHVALLAAGLAGAGCGSSGGKGAHNDGSTPDTPPLPTCPGSGLFGDPARTCPPPDPPIANCTFGDPQVKMSLPVVSSTFEAEMMTAVDPRPGSQLAYAATIESIVASDGTVGSPTGACIIRKRIHVYRSQDLGKTWGDMPGTQNLPHRDPFPIAGGGTDPGDWLTDPDISVGVDGTVYLTTQLNHGTLDCQTAQNLQVVEVQLWTAPPPEGGQDPGLKPAFGPSQAGLPNVAVGADHPQVTASRASSGQVMVSGAFADQGTGNSIVATFQRGANGLFHESAPRIVTDAFSNLATDENGELYVATAAGNLEPKIRRFHWNQDHWDEVASALVPLAPDRTSDEGARIPSPPSDPNHPIILASDITPALIVSALGSTTTPIVYVAFPVTLSDDAPADIEVAAVNSDELAQPDKWQVRVVPHPPGSIQSFHPNLGLDGPGNVLDLLAFDLKGPPGGAPDLSAFELSDRKSVV